MNYIVKNIILFVSVVTVFMFLLIGVHVFSLDREVIREKNEQLTKLNIKFSSGLEKTIKKPFVAVNFLAKSSYPLVALDFGMSQQFFDVAREILPDDSMGLVLLNQNKKVISTFGVEQNSLNEFLQTKTDDEEFVVVGSNLAYYKHIVSNGVIRGYLVGVYPFEKIKHYIGSSYRDISVGLELLNPTIILTTSSHTAFPLVVDFQSRQPTLFQSTINGRWLAAIISFSLLILTVFTYLLRSSLKKPIDDLNRIAMRFSLNDNVEITSVRLPKDPLFHGIAKSLVIMNQQRREFEILQREKEIGLKLYEIAQQVAHDIRSPLAALTMVTSHLQDLPEETRLLVRSAVQRIHDIANDLAGKKIKTSVHGEISQSKDEPSLQLLSGIVDTLVSEKRMQYRAKIGIEIDAQLDRSSYGLFAEIQPIEFKRVLSNLINNAVEVLTDGGRVGIKLFADQMGIKVQVADNGRGIPPEILAKLMQRGETHGKAGGSGLGLYHARKSVEAWGGSAEINSVIGQGTTVTLTLPRKNAPEWFVPELQLSPESLVVILDDDNSIHQIWKGRFESSASNHQIKLVHFSMPTELAVWYKAHSGQNERILFLCDYEFIGSDKTGLDVIRELGIERDAVLVTSRFEEDAVRRGCEELNLRLIPKNLAGFVPIVCREKNAKGTSQRAPTREIPDAVLIDDDELVHMNWKMTAKRKNKILRAYTGSAEFWNAESELSKETPIYIDSNLSDDIKGEDVAKELRGKGYENLYLATGYDASTFKAMPWLKGIVGKGPPWS